MNRLVSVNVELITHYQRDPTWRRSFEKSIKQIVSLSCVLWNIYMVILRFVYFFNGSLCCYYEV